MAGVPCALGDVDPEPPTEAAACPSTFRAVLPVLSAVQEQACSPPGLQRIRIDTPVCGEVGGGLEAAMSRHVKNVVGKHPQDAAAAVLTGETRYAGQLLRQAWEERYPCEAAGAVADNKDADAASVALEGQALCTQGGSGRETDSASGQEASTSQLGKMFIKLNACRTVNHESPNSKILVMDDVSTDRQSDIVDPTGFRERSPGRQGAMNEQDGAEKLGTEVEQAQLAQMSGHEVLHTLYEDSQSSLSSFSESEFPFIFTPTPKGECGGNYLGATVSPWIGDSQEEARMFEGRSEIMGARQGMFLDHDTGSETEEPIAQVLDFDLLVTPRERNRESLILWVQNQRSAAVEWNYLRIGASTRIQTEWRRFRVRRTFLALKSSCRRLLSYSRAKMAHRAITHRIVGWLDHEFHLKANYAYNRKRKSSKKSQLSHSSPMRSVLLGYSKGEEDLLEEIDLIRRQVESLTPHEYLPTTPPDLRRLYAQLEEFDDCEQSDTDLQLSSLKLQWFQTNWVENLQEKACDLLSDSHRGNGVARDPAGMLARVGGAESPGTRTETKGHGGLRGVVRVQEGERDRWEMSPNLALRIDGLLSLEGLSPTKCRDKFLIRLCNIVSRTDEDSQRTTLRQWRQRVSKRRMLRTAIAEHPIRNLHDALCAWRSEVGYKAGRRQWRQAVQEDAIALYDCSDRPDEVMGQGTWWRTPPRPRGLLQRGMLHFF